MKHTRNLQHFGKLGSGVILCLMMYLLNCAVYTPPPPPDFCVEKASSSRNAILTYDVPREQFQNQALRMRSSGFYPGDVDVYEKQNQKFFSAVWNPNIGTEWTIHNLVDLNQWREFQIEWERRRESGWQLREVEIFEESGVRQILAIWQKAAIATKFRANIRPLEFSIVLEEMRRQGYLLVDFEAYTARGRVLFVTVWRQERADQRYLDAASARNFEEQHRQLRSQGFTLIDFEIYRAGLAKHYVGVWRQGGGDTRLWMEADCANFGAKFNEFSQAGFKLIDAEIDFDATGNMLFSGVWSLSSFSR